MPYLTEVKLNMSNDGLKKDLGDVQEMHRSIMKLFPQYASTPRAEAGVLWALDTDGPRLLIQSQEEITLPKFASKHIGEVKEGEIYRVVFVGNPVVNRTMESGRSKRCAITASDQQREWFGRQMHQAGMKPLSTRITNSGYVKGNRQGRQVTLYAVRFVGSVEVVDATLANSAIATGIGHGKAYGCGLLHLEEVAA